MNKNKAVMEKSKDLIESYKLTTVRNRIGIYGQRLILRLIEYATASGMTEGLSFKDGKDIRSVEVGKWGENTIIMPLKDITLDSDNRSKPRSSIIALMQEVIEAEDADGTWIAFPFLTYAKVSGGQLTVKVRQELWQVFMDFSKGFRRFELNAALKLNSTYSLRFYKLVSEQDASHIDFQLDDLKKMLGIADKYPRARDFFVKVIGPAKAELDDIAPWTFDYTPLTGRKNATAGRAAIVAIRIFPRYQPANRDKDLEVNSLRRKFPGALSPGLTVAQKNILIHKFGFTQKGLLNNRDLFEQTIRILDLSDFLQELAERVAKLRPKNVQGYVINSIRAELAAQGVDV